MRERTMLFLGAGASRHFGYPLTGEILAHVLGPASPWLPSAGPVSGRGASPRQVLLKDLLLELWPGMGVVGADIPSITEILSFVDEHIRTGLAPSAGFRFARMSELRRLLEQGILHVTSCAVHNVDRTKVEEDAAKLMAILAIWSSKAESHCSIISTNYDLLVENRLFPELRAEQRGKVCELVDFGVDWRDVASGSVNFRPTAARISILKLHGSLNFLRCDLCDHLYVNELGSIADLAYALSDIGGESTCECGHSPLSPVLVTPSLVRDIRDSSLRSIWRAAIESLRNAERWIFVGYSLPAEDLAIRSLLKRAFNARPTPPRVSAFMVSDTQRGRYLLDFPGCKYHTTGMAGFLKSELEG